MWARWDKNRTDNSFSLRHRQFRDSQFSHVFFKDRLCLAQCFAQREDRNGPSMSPSTMFCAGNAAMCFLPYVLRSGRSAAALHSSKGYVLRRLVNRRPAAKTKFRAVVSFKPYVLRSERTAGELLCRQMVFSAQCVMSMMSSARGHDDDRGQGMRDSHR